MDRVAIIYKEDKEIILNYHYLNFKLSSSDKDSINNEAKSILNDTFYNGDKIRIVWDKTIDIV